MLKNKSNTKFYSLFCVFLIIFSFLLCFFSSFSPNVVLAFSPSSSVEWLDKTWTGLTAFSGNNVWTDGVNIFCFDTSSNGTYLLNVDNSSWSLVDNLNMSSFDIDCIWSDGTNTFYSNGSTQKIFNSVDFSWSNFYFNKVIYGDEIWSDGTNIFYSDGSQQCVLDKSTSTWSTKTWTGLTSFNGHSVWTLGNSIFYSDGSQQYVLDKSTSTWSTKTWTGLTAFKGVDIWTLFDTAFYNNAFAGSYVLDKSTSTWSTKTWTGLTPSFAFNVWSDGVNVFYSVSTSQFVLNSSLGFIDDIYNNAYENGASDTANKYSGFGIFLNCNYSVYITSTTGLSDKLILSGSINSSDNSYFAAMNGGVVFNSTLSSFIENSISSNIGYSGGYVKFDIVPVNISQFYSFTFNNFQFGNGAKFYLNNGKVVSFSNSDLSTSLSSFSLIEYSNFKLNSISLIFANIDYLHNIGVSSNISNTVSYENGFNDGINSVDTDKYFNNGFTAGYNSGKHDGIASANDYSFISLFGAIFDAPVKAFTSLFNFNLLGVNILSLITALFTLCVIVVIIRFCFGGK